MFFKENAVSLCFHLLVLSDYFEEAPKNIKSLKSDSSVSLLHCAVALKPPTYISIYWFPSAFTESSLYDDFCTTASFPKL